ncbi:ArsR family transcriptional regulator [Arthrobacter sp. MYb227]|uniref:transcriptional regulator n=1 Tax=Arthrobacter sp. MYb227 TaxID=1848601 RepID=UPI000CFB48D1|nr:transcriptional regulator [Arthrobacter sp. MYb227]PQZ93538.1 ArsR family transcriptional regulator [Arthrobacter sp. MYb227]
MVHPRHGLDDAFQTPIRFSLMAALGHRTEVDFATLRDVLEANDSVLSKAISYLEKVGYVQVTKGNVGNRSRTWVESTVKGHRAFQIHLLALRTISEGYLD